MVNVTRLAVFDRSLEKTGVILDEIREGLGTASAEEAYMALRATLHALRDRLSVNEAVQLGAQLPLVLKGVYYDGWQPAKTPHATRRAEEFLGEVAAHFRWHPRDAESMVRTALAVVARHVSEGEMLQVKHSLPKDIQTLLP
jgi:uncharacterized protein (DUF2267 family)